MTFTPIDQERNLANKRRVSAALQAVIDGPAEQIEAALAAAYADGALTRSSHPVNDQHGAAAIAATFWRPLRHALPDVERRDWLIIGGVDSDSGLDHVAISGFYVGTFTNDLFDIPANRQSVKLRYNEMHRLENGVISKSWIWVDYLALMHQIGYWPVAPSLGAEGQWLAPRTQDALIFTPQDAAASMDDPDFSDLVGQIEFGPAPRAYEGGPYAAHGGTGAGLSIPAFSDVDPEIAFLVIMEALDLGSQAEAAKVGVVSRTAVAAVADARYLPAVDATIVGGVKDSSAPVVSAVLNSILGQWLPLIMSGEWTAQELLDATAEAYIEEATAQGFMGG